MTAIAAKQNLLTTSTALSVASVTTSGYSTLNGVRVAAGGGQHGTGASLRVTGTGDLAYNPANIFVGGSSVDTHQFELSWLGFANWYRANALTAGSRQVEVNMGRERP